MRLHKYLANCGIASRRKAEELIVLGEVVVNGKTVKKVGTSVDPENDSIKVFGKLVRKPRPVYVLLNKPRGFVTTVSDERGRRTVLELVAGIKERIYPVGRLDRDSEGLLVLTNDGDLTQFLTHPACGVKKTYQAAIEGYLNDETLVKLRRGVRVGARKVTPARITLISRSKKTSRLEIQIGEGLNREVRRLFAVVGHEVKKLTRTRIGPLNLKGLPRGRARLLTSKELKNLKSLLAEYNW